MQARYAIRNCCGTLVETVVVEAYGELDLDENYQREDEVLADTEYGDRGKCVGCGDSRFRAHFVEYV